MYKNLSIVTRNPDLSINQGEPAIAHVYTVDTADGVTLAECGGAIQAAKLFAAAPELLEALKLIVADVYSGTPINMDDQRMMDALDAISKAEGKGE